MTTTTSASLLETILSDLDAVYLSGRNNDRVCHPAVPGYYVGEEIAAHPAVVELLAKRAAADEARHHANRDETIEAKTLGHRTAAGTAWPRNAYLSRSYRDGKVREYTVEVICNGVHDSKQAFRRLSDARQAWDGLGSDRD
jgi:hypothetical protein